MLLQSVVVLVYFSMKDVVAGLITKNAKSELILLSQSLLEKVPVWFSFSAKAVIEPRKLQMHKVCCCRGCC